METFCKETAAKYQHFLYGGMPGVPELLGKTLKDRFGINVVGEYSPPFRALTEQEDEEILARIGAVKPDVLWIGLSTPKQERWMYEHRPSLQVPVIVGVGAAFDLICGRTKQAPIWMREHGLEWSFRLLTEPRRLWRRYLIYGSEFIWKVTFELLTVHTFD
jgi:N-acetylglucosaminyldiphosphoundecaprenol N-acetyl-beta-D-mannosaminyltransferase